MRKALLVIALVLAVATVAAANIRYAVDPATGEVVRRSAPCSRAGVPCPPVDLDIFKAELSAKDYAPEALIYYTAPVEQFEALRPLTKGQVVATVEGGQVTEVVARASYHLAIFADKTEVAANDATAAGTFTLSFTLSDAQGAVSYDGTLKIPFRLNGNPSSKINVSFTGGVATMEASNLPAGRYSILASEVQALLAPVAASVGRLLVVSGNVEIEAWN